MDESGGNRTEIDKTLFNTHETQTQRCIRDISQFPDTNVLESLMKYVAQERSYLLSSGQASAFFKTVSYPLFCDDLSFPWSLVKKK